MKYRHASALLCVLGMVVLSAAALSQDATAPPAKTRLVEMSCRKLALAPLAAMSVPPLKFNVPLPPALPVVISVALKVPPFKFSVPLALLLMGRFTRLRKVEPPFMFQTAG